MSQKRLFVTGTDTNIGKTVLSLIIMQYYYYKKFNPVYIKPFQTGCSGPNAFDTDAAFIYSSTPELINKAPSDSIINCFKKPKAPFFAARDERREIDTEKVLKEIDMLSKGHSHVIIEGAGGLMVPLTRSSLIIDIIPALKARTILAARAGLGTINHTLLSIGALKQKGITDPVIVLVAQPGNPVTNDMILENMEAIELFSGIKPSGVIPDLGSFSPIDTNTISILDSILQSI